jgi:hypothetical protein
MKNIFKTFRDLCNNNSGFIGFCGYCYCNPNLDFSKNKFDFGKIIGGIISTLTYQINVPTYAIIVFFILVWVLVRKRIGNWNSFFIKSISQK